MAALVATSPQPMQLFGQYSSHMSPSAHPAPRSPETAPSSLPPVETSQAQKQMLTPPRAHENFKRAKNLEAFNSLLPPAVEFVEGSSTGALALASVEGKYEPINASPKAKGHSEVSIRIHLISLISTIPLRALSFFCNVINLFNGSISFFRA